MDTATLLGLLAALAVGLAIGGAIGVLAGALRAARPHDQVTRTAAEQAVVRESLDRLHDQLRDLESQRVSWQSQLRQHVDDVRLSTDSLRRETSALSTALRRPQVRGRWGELHLRRAVELAGLVSRCDFEEQASVRADGGDGGLLRPDLVVRLAGGRQVVVDAKVPLEAVLDAVSTEDDQERTAHLARHARQLRQHVDALSSKRYWRHVADTPEFVVLFLPVESFLSAALEADPALLEYAAERQVVLATPTTLIALLRTVALGWRQESLAERAREVHELGRQLHERLGTLGGHLDRLGRSLNASVGAYNQAVGSLEGRVLVTARRFADVTGAEELTPPGRVEVQTRPLSATELLATVAETRDEIDVDAARPAGAAERSRHSA